MQNSLNGFLFSQALKLFIAYNKPKEATRIVLAFSSANDSTVGLYKIERAVSAF